MTSHDPFRTTALELQLPLQRRDAVLATLEAAG